MARDQDQGFLQNFIIILVMISGIFTVYIILTRVLGNPDTVITEQVDQVIIEKTRPVGEFRLSLMSAQGRVPEQGTVVNGDEAAGTEADPGKEVYDGLCFTCHSTNLPNIPQVGDKIVWADKIEQGIPLLYERAIKGFTGESGMVMPSRGGNHSLSDEEVRAAVDYMIASSQ